MLLLPRLDPHTLLRFSTPSPYSLFQPPPTPPPPPLPSAGPAPQPNMTRFSSFLPRKMGIAGLYFFYSHIRLRETITLRLLLLICRSSAPAAILRSIRSPSSGTSKAAAGLSRLFSACRVRKPQIMSPHPPSPFPYLQADFMRGRTKGRIPSFFSSAREEAFAARFYLFLSFSWLREYCIIGANTAKPFFPPFSGGRAGMREFVLFSPSPSLIANSQRRTVV